MLKRKLVLEDRPYTFSDYFNLNYEVDEILDYFGYGFQIENAKLPRAEINRDEADLLKRRLEEGLPYVSLNSEVARREFLIAPVIWEIIRLTHSKVKVEYPLQVNDKLKGTLDYFIQAQNNLLIVEAKQADPQRGFNQLAVELVALDKATDNGHEIQILHGAISLGNFWQFGLLDRANQIVIQDLNLFTVPTHIDELLSVLVAILTR